MFIKIFNTLALIMHPSKLLIKIKRRISLVSWTPWSIYYYQSAFWLIYAWKVEGSITINKVINISNEIYQEVKYNEVHPYKNSYFSDKIHHICEVGEYTIIGGCKETFIFWNINYINYFLQGLFIKWKTKFNY